MGIVVADVQEKGAILGPRFEKRLDGLVVSLEVPAPPELDALMDFLKRPGVIASPLQVLQDGFLPSRHGGVEAGRSGLMRGFPRQYGGAAGAAGGRRRKAT